MHTAAPNDITPNALALLPFAAIFLVAAVWFVVLFVRAKFNRK